MLIDQAKNFASDFGYVERSSAIFYKPSGIDLTVSVSNYWLFKNGLVVRLRFSVRSMCGQLVEQRILTFDESNVINFEVDSVQEGSIEIEALSHENLRIPYAAVMGVYEADNAVSMVHSYGRNLSLSECEHGASFSMASEGCWRVRSGAAVRNFAVFHNGHKVIEEQSATISLLAFDGSTTVVDFVIPRLAPYQTYKFELNELVDDLQGVLLKKDGWCTVKFIPGSAFPRMLICWENTEEGCFQVTHSNFDYGVMETNQLEGVSEAIMVLPKINGRLPNYIVYPVPHAENLFIKHSASSDVFPLTHGVFEASEGQKQINFISNANSIPSRIVTGLTAGTQDDLSLGFECSLGVFHCRRPPKFFHWAVASSRLKTMLHLTYYNTLYAVEDTPIELTFTVYSPNTTRVMSVVKTFRCLSSVPEEFSLEDVFGCVKWPDEYEFFWFSMYSNYPGFVIYTSFQKKDCLTIEHAF